MANITTNETANVQHMPSHILPEMRVHMHITSDIVMNVRNTFPLICRAWQECLDCAER